MARRKWINIASSAAENTRLYWWTCPGKNCSKIEYNKCLSQLNLICDECNYKYILKQIEGSRVLIEVL